MASRRAALVALLAMPGAATVYLSFSAGGFFPDSQAALTVVLAAALVLRTTLADEPFAGFSRPLALALGAIGLYAVWILASALWSDAPARALLEFDRALLYGLGLALFGSLPRKSARIAWAMRGLALGVVAVCLFSFLSRALPAVWSTVPTFANERLSYPLTYWNALGLLAALGMILCLHLTSSAREAAAVRIGAAGALPLLGATLLLTFSRGAIVAAVVGGIAYAALGRPRVLLGGLLAALPATAVAVASAYGAERLATADPTSPGAIAQGEDLAVVVAVCVIGAATARLALMGLDRALVRRSIGERVSLAVKLAVPAVVVASAVAVGVAAGVPGELERQYDRFVASDFDDQGDVRARLSNPGNNGRLEIWDVALGLAGDEPVVGHGAGTFQVAWAQRRPTAQGAVDGHSLYLETLAELGIVGLTLVMVTVVAMLVGVAARLRETRSLYAALLALMLAWVLRSAVDWDWEMPAVTFWLFALGGLALAARPQAGQIRSPARLTRIATAVGVLVLAVTPALVFVSQTRLEGAVAAFDRGDCGSAVDGALASNAALGVRPEPFEILAYCDSRLGVDALAIQAMRSAVERDPENWEFHYGLALVTGTAGRDPRPAAEAARRLNPREPLTRKLVERLGVGGPRRWMRVASTAPLPFGLGGD